MLRPGIIYKITNTVNGKSYIGQTIKSESERWATHLKDAVAGSGYGLHRAIRKHGDSSFSVEVIAESTEEFLDELEIFFIRLYNTQSQFGYNMTSGGDGCRGCKWTDESRANLSAAKKGTHHSDETKRKIGLSHKSRKLSATQVEQMRKNQTGKKTSVETRKAMSIAASVRKQRPCSDETKAKISQANSGKSHSGESLNKMRPTMFTPGRTPWNKGRKLADK
jgi:group I intron endonuclease